ncbi:MAG TPA: ATP-binding protein, partial [Steroidobacteraceae bacterium]|nr:ATP-binding protein [Steroidobacteraceae bacterium]
DDARVQRVRQMMDRQVTQLVKLIDDLLEVSRISTGKVVLQTERVDLRRVVEAALESSQPAIQAAQHSLRVELPSAPVWVKGDPSRLEQVICNVVNNACKYTAKGGDISLILTDVSNQAVLQVTDNGLGIPQEMLPFVFDMFTQVDRNLDRAQGGLGIGLSLVRRLMELHGGEVRAESPGPNKGSTFTLVLPLVDADAPIESKQAAAGARAAARPLRVLVIDDNRDAADALSMLLTTHGHQTRIAYGGAAALEIAREFEPETVFCDLGMPGISGFDVASRLRKEQKRGAPLLVALTGWGTDEDKRKTREGGFDFHVTKPITFDDVDRILSHVRTG